MGNGYGWTMWKSRIGSALRTGWACVMVGVAIEYYQARLHKPMDFQPFAYLTATLIVGEACLGEAMQGVVLALYGTLQGACPALLGLWLLGPSTLSPSTLTLMLALTAFLVSLPKSTHIVTKRLALGQIVIIYVAAFMHRREQMDGSLYPLRAAFSTAVGAVASVLALLLPVPRLACLKIQEKIRLMGEISCNMLELLATAYSAESVSAAHATVSQLKVLADARAHILSTLRQKQANIGWEKPLISCLVPNFGAILKAYFSLERPINSMEIALESCPSFPIAGPMGQKNLKDLLSVAVERIGKSVAATMASESKDSSQVYGNDTEAIEISFEELEGVAPTSPRDLPLFFYLFSIKNLYEGVVLTQKQKEKTTKQSKNGINIQKGKGGWSLKIDPESLLMAAKCSISLGLSVLFGILFTKDNGYWGGLVVAVSLAPQREPAFKMANMRAQGTVLGSVYGVLGCFLAQRFQFLRYIALIPWVVFTSFLRQSDMYGYAGGLTAFIGAVIILGRRDYGSPSQFAIERITETFVGILCCILVELIFLPRRASTLARNKLLVTLKKIGDSMTLLGCTNKPCLSLSEMKETWTRLRTHLTELKNLIEEAKAEPGFWFLPFPYVCYGQLFSSLTVMVDLLDSLVDTIHSLPHVPCVHMFTHGETYKAIGEDLDEFRNCIGSHFVCFQEVLQVKSLKGLTEEYQKKKEEGVDPESGRIMVVGGERMDTTVESFVGHIGEALVHVDEGMREMRVQLVLGLGAMGFCMGSIIKESKKIECAIQELLQRENPMAHVNLWKIHHMVMEVTPS